MATLPKLQLQAAAGQALTPEQRKFNQLVAKIEALRERLAQWNEQGPLLAQTHAKRVRPLMQAMQQRRVALVRQLLRLLDAPGWGKVQRRTLVGELCEELDGLIENEFSTDAEVEEFKALFAQHAGVSHEDEQRQGLQAMRAMLEDRMGLDLGDREFSSEDELLDFARDKMQQARERLEPQEPDARSERQPGRPQHKPRRPGAAERRREQQAQDAAQSLRDIYRKLASALHPDRADDEADRERRTALMKRVNEANDAEDLLALFALQLEIEQVDAAHIARASAEKARHYNQVLVAQVEQLQAQLQSVEMDLRFDFNLDPFQPVDPKRLGKMLDAEVRDMRKVLGFLELQLQMLASPQGARLWIKRVRDEQKMLGDDDFLF